MVDWKWLELKSLHCQALTMGENQEMEVPLTVSD
jgi:hypothetical protein